MEAHVIAESDKTLEKESKERTRDGMPSATSTPSAASLALDALIENLMAPIIDHIEKKGWVSRCPYLPPSFLDVCLTYV